MTLRFETAQWVVRDLRPEQVPDLQRLFEANPDYFVLVDGQPPGPGEAQRAFDEPPPAHLRHGPRWFAGVFDRDGTLCGLIILVADLAAQGVWHTALFFLDRRLWGSGAAAALHAALEATARAAGAQWLRLGVVEGNGRAQRFWARCGYQPVRSRPMTNDRGEARTVWVMVKPLADAPLAGYLQLVPRDAPGSALP